MTGLSIHLLGPLDIRHDDGGADAPASLKAQELLCYLLLHRDRPVPRTSLAALLWADHDAAHGLKQLRQALWHLQTACARPDTEPCPLLETTPRSILLRSGSHLWLDVGEFEAVFARVRGPVAHQLEPADAELADQAITLYRGDLLEGFDFDWCIVEREWLRSAYLTMLDRLMGYCERHGEYELGIDYGERILRVDRAREYTHRRMMVLHALLGNRTGALRQYTRCAAALREELDVLPARSTTLLRDQIRTSADPATLLATPRLAPPALRDGSPTPTTAERPRRIQRALLDLQSPIQSEFRGLEAET